MKTFVSILIFACCIPLAQAEPSARAAQKQAIRKAHDLFQSGHDQDAVDYLRANLTLTSGRSETIEVANGLAEISWSFYNQRRLTTARRVANEALAILEPSLKKKNLSADEAQLFGRIGFLCDQVLCAPTLAQPLYEAALAGGSEDTMTAVRLKELKSKETNRRVKGGE